MASGRTDRMRRLVKTGIARALTSAHADLLIGGITGARGVPLVLGYHRVVESFAAEVRRAIPGNLTSLRRLEEQLDWVGRRFSFVSVDEMGERIERGDTTPVAAGTFDDGYR